MPTLSELAGLPPPKINPGEPGLDGVSLAHILDPSLPAPSGSVEAGGKGWALSVYPRCPTDPKGHGLWYSECTTSSPPAVCLTPRRGSTDNWCIEVDRANFTYVGFSLRTHGWRYTAWQPWDGEKLAAKSWPAARPTNGTGSPAFFEELFAYSEAPGSELDLDALDVAEVGGEQGNAAVMDTLYAQIRAYALGQ